MSQISDRVLVLAEVASFRHVDGWFAPVELRKFFDELRLPPPGNVNETMQSLKRRDLLLRHSAGRRWSLTPLGRRYVNDLIGEIDPLSVEAHLVGYVGAEFGHATHLVIPPSFAPPKWSSAISRLLDIYPFEANVFFMTRFPDKEDLLDPIHTAIEVVRNALESHGLHLHMASDRQLDDDLLGNVAAHMWACQYGIGIAEDRIGRGLNYNVMIEVGSMLMTGRRCAVLKDRTILGLPADFAGQIYKSIDLDDMNGISKATHQWAADDLGFGECRVCATTSKT